jgi:hypothetical protein
MGNTIGQQKSPYIQIWAVELLTCYIKLGLSQENIIVNWDLILLGLGVSEREVCIPTFHSNN